MKKIMFDSNIFDKMPEFIDIIRTSISEYKYYVTSIQVEEICEISNLKKEQRIVNMLMLTDIRAELVPTAVAIPGRARLGYTRLGNGEVFDKIFDGRNTCDAIIADTSIFEGCTLVTEDKKLYKKMKLNNYDVMFFW